MTFDPFLIDLFMRQYLLETICCIIISAIICFLVLLSMILAIRNAKDLTDIEPIAIIFPFLIIVASFIGLVGNSIQLVRYYYVPEKIIMENQDRIDKDYQNINRVPESYRSYKPENVVL